MNFVVFPVYVVFVDTPFDPSPIIRSASVEWRFTSVAWNTWVSIRQTAGLTPIDSSAFTMRKCAVNVLDGLELPPRIWRSAASSSVPTRYTMCHRMSPKPWVAPQFHDKVH